jgi:hypothetical protein
MKMPKGIYKRIEYHRKRISDGLKGKMPKNLELLKSKAHHFEKGHSTNVGKVCSIEKKRDISKSMTGRKPWNYIDGRSKLVSPDRYGDDWDKIRYLVYLRDHFTCQNCGIKNIRLDVHHKIPFLISFDNSLNNLISLCKPCHRKEEAIIMRELKLKQENKLLVGVSFANL